MNLQKYTSQKVKRLDAERRWYSRGESNNWKPSVTTVIGETCAKGKHFEEWLMKNGLNAITVRDESARRGTKVHEYIEMLLDENEVKVEDEFTQKSLMSFEKFYNEVKPEVVEKELFLYHKDIPWAGTPDIIAKINNRLSLVDIKTGDYRKTHEIQQLMYKELWNTIFPDNPILDMYGLYTKGKWIKEPSYGFRKFKDSDMHHSVYKLWCFLNFPYGKPWPKQKPQLKKEFKLGPKPDARSIDELL
tara:strand:- start:5182 stop:5919 length:738 start_codon:yes stop_codon:yes gene_type:complete